MVAASGADTCAHVTVRHLREITFLDLRNQNITSVSAGDFDGLVRLQALDLSGNLLLSLPEGIFDELYLLKTLRLDNNRLETLPEDILDELLHLEELTLHENPGLTLPTGMFEDFSRFAGMAANGDPPDNSGSYPRIQRFLDRHDVTSLEAFITALPEVFKERSVMVSASESAGKVHGSGGYPRIISFGGDGRFIFAWSIDPAAPSGYRDSIEFLRQDATAWTAGVIDFSRGEPELSQPESCRSCHGGLHKPLWGSSSGSIGTGFPESGHDGQNREVTAASEASAVFARRHAEVLFHRLKARSDYRRFAEETLCSASGSEVLAGALGAFSQSDRDLGLLSDKLQPIQESRNTPVDPDEPGRVQGTVGSTLVFLLVFDLWQQEPIVRKLFREPGNEDSGLPSRPASIDTLLHDGRHVTTAEDELIQRYRRYFGHGDRSLLETRRRPINRTEDPGSPSAKVGLEPPERMAQSVCGALRESRPRNLRVSLRGGKAVLSWEPPDEDAALSGYRILRGASAAALQMLVEDTGTTRTTWTDTGPAPGHDVYAVMALFDGYPSPASNAARGGSGFVAGPGPTASTAYGLKGGKKAVPVRGFQSPDGNAEGSFPGDLVARAASAGPNAAAVCDRTQAVRDAIASDLGTPCGSIARARLKEILTLDLSGQSITALSAGDFDGLDRLRTLDLSDNELASLPAGVFDPLLTVETLRLHDNRLASLPAGLFDKLLTLRDLTLHGNLLTELPDSAGMFDDFSPFGGLSLTEAPGTRPGGLAVLRGFLAKHSVDSVEEFVAALPPAHKKNFVMVYESQGLGAEFVSAEFPRMISWGADGRFLFAWTTNPETAEPFKSAVEFLIAEGDEWEAGVVDFSGEEPSIAHPQSCASCHGSRHKPLWGTGVLSTFSEAAQGTEEDATRSNKAWQSTRDLMNSNSPRIGPMDFEASSLKRRDARRLRAFATVADEFSAAVARQHAEVLFQDLLKRPDREAVFRDLLAGYDPLYGGVAALEIFGSDLLPSFVEATGSHLEHAYGTPSFFYFHFGSLLHALDFRVQYHLWREREDVRALFAGRSNAGMDGFEKVFLIEPFAKFAVEQVL